MFALNPIEVPKPPKHTQVPIACETCVKANVCILTPHYRKTVTLIQNILGDPQLDRELVPDCGFSGLDFEDLTIFPQEIVLKKDDVVYTGCLISAKYIDENKVKILYDVDKYLVMLVLKYAESFDKFELISCKELYYGIEYTITEEQLDLITTNLPEWREELIRKEEEEQGEIINTTYFSAILKCQEYIPNKPARPHHDCEDMPYVHVGTFHKEKAPVNEYHNYNPPIAYPVFLREPKRKKPSKRRDDV